MAEMIDKKQYRRFCLFFSATGISAVLFVGQLMAGGVAGVVRNVQTGKPLCCAHVEIVEIGRSTVTDSSGSYKIDSLDPGTYTLQCLLRGFEAFTRNDVYIAGEGTKPVDIELSPQILVLDKMVVTSSAFHRAADMSSSTKIINADELLRAPGALVDVQRVVQNLPSVTSGGDNINEVVVRGGMPGENLLIMDHIEIPNANHFADQHSGGGVISLINPLLVKGLTFNAGAPPAQYGGKASSVIDVTLRDGNDVLVLGGVDIGMAGAGGHVEGPMWKGSNFMISGHKSYLDLIASFEPTIAIPKFWGFQGKVSQKFSDHYLSANCVYGKNYIKIEQLGDEGMEYDVIESGGIVYAGGMSWKANLNKRFSTLLVVSATGNTFDRLSYNPSYDTLINDTLHILPRDTFFTGDTWNDEQTVQSSCMLDLYDNNIVQIGMYGKRCVFHIDQKEKPDTLKDYLLDPVNGVPVISTGGNPVVFGQYADVEDVTYKYGGYISCTIHTLNRLRLVPGIRFDGLTFNDNISFSPRCNAVLSLTGNLDITSAFAFQYQEPEFVDLVIDSRNRTLSPKQVITGIAGIEYYLETLNIKFISEGFYKHYNNLLVDCSYLTADSLDETDQLADDGSGYSYGLELFAEKKMTQSFFWTVAFALSKSWYKDLRPGHEGEWYDGDYDFRHSFTVTGGWKTELLNKNWYKTKFHDKLWFKLLSPIMPIADRIELSAKWRYLDGKPYTDKKFSYQFEKWYIDTGEKLNDSRNDPYHRLDLRFERRYGFGFLQMIYYIDIQNIYNRSNIWTWLYPEKSDTKIPIYQFPIFPAGGVIIGF